MNVRLPRVVLALSIALTCGPALAGVGSDLPVDEGALPAGARASWLQVRLLAPVAEHWTDTWKWPEPKGEVASALAGALKALEAESAKAPSNVNLLLATGIAARFAHNLDVEGAPESGLKALNRAIAAAPKDPRPRWQLGVNYCETGQFTDAMVQFAAARDLWVPGRPPPAYWRNELECFHTAGMPAHVLRSASELRREGPLSDLHESLVRQDTALMVRPTPTSELAAQEAFQVQDVGGVNRFVSMPCGFAVPLLTGMKPGASPVKTGTCLAQFEMGPFDGKTGEVVPMMVVLARTARDGESLKDFLDLLVGDRKAVPAEVCPVDTCLGFERAMPTSYTHEGGGVAVVVAFERKAPAYPSALLEQPFQPPKTEGGGVQYFRAVPRPTRFDGRIYYIVLLDTARSVEAAARATFKNAVRNMMVE